MSAPHAAHHNVAERPSCCLLTKMPTAAPQSDRWNFNKLGAKSDRKICNTTGKKMQEASWCFNLLAAPNVVHHNGVCWQCIAMVPTAAVGTLINSTNITRCRNLRSKIARPMFWYVSHCEGYRPVLSASSYHSDLTDKCVISSMQCVLVVPVVHMAIWHSVTDKLLKRNFWTV